MFQSIKNRLGSVVVTTLLVCIVVACVLMAWPNRYGSDGMLYIRLGRGVLSTDPGSQHSSSVSFQESRASEVVSIAEMIGGREIAERAVNKLGVAKINEPRNWFERAMVKVEEVMPASTHSTPTMTAEEYSDQVEREEAVKRVQSLLSINVPKEGYTVAISGTGNDPELVQSVVQTVMDEYKNYHVEAHSANGSLEFFDQQVTASREQALAAQKELQETRSKMGWLSAESGVVSLQERKIKLEISLDVAESELAEAQSSAKENLRQLASVLEWVPTEILKGVPNNAGDDMRSQLYGLQVQESEAIAKLMPSHPRYRMLQEKMSQSKQIMSEEGMEREQTVEALNPVRQQLETDYQVAIARAAGLESRRDAILKRLEQADEEILNLNRDSISLANLKWRAEIAEDNYLGHAKSLEEARVMAELDNQNMSDVSIIQNASLNLKKEGPPRLLLLTVGSVLGLLMGMLQAIVRDQPTVRDQLATAGGSSSQSADQNESGHKEINSADERHSQTDGYESEEELVMVSAHGAHGQKKHAASSPR